MIDGAFSAEACSARQPSGRMLQSWTKIVSIPDKIWEQLIWFHKLDTRRVFDSCARIRCQIECIDKIGGDTWLYLRSELRHNMCSLYCARRTRVHRHFRAVIDVSKHGASARCQQDLCTLVLRALWAMAIGKSDESPQQTNSSDCHQTLHKHVLTCYSNMSGADVCL